VGAPATAPADRLAAAIDRLAAGYAFDTGISVGGKLATRAQGRASGGASDFRVESNGASITYRTVPPTSWVKQAGKAWVIVDNGVPDGDPLEALRSPTSIKVVADAPDGVSLKATYPASALGLAGTDPVTVELRVASDGSVGATYSVQSASGPATSETTLRPQPDQDPIVAPSPIATV
jgi:hypothetical protein